MWMLIHTTQNTYFHLIQDKTQYIVSRNAESGDLVLNNDTSISRAHAIIFRNGDKIEISDSGSKYGTYINENIDVNAPIEKNKKIQLNNADIVRFGRLDNVWRLEKFNIVTMSSTLTVEEKKDLYNDITLLSGKICENWSGDNSSKPTHLTVSNLTITMKVLQALSGCIPIVTMAYWKALVAAAQTQSSTLPRPADYLPSINNEPYITKDTNIDINAARTCLFNGKHFYFMLTKHKERFELPIKLAGGKCVAMDKARVAKKNLLKDDAIVILYNPSTQSQASQDIESVSDYLAAKNLRIIPDCEIGLAILNCTIEKFCNPKYKINDAFKVSGLFAQPSKIVVENTPMNEIASTSNAVANVLQIKVEETPISLLADTQPFVASHEVSGSKRKLSESEKSAAPPERKIKLTDDNTDAIKLIITKDDTDVSTVADTKAKDAVIHEKEPEQSINLNDEQNELKIQESSARKRKASPVNRPSTRSKLDESNESEKDEQTEIFMENISQSQFDSSAGWHKKPAPKSILQEAPPEFEASEVAGPSKTITMPPPETAGRKRKFILNENSDDDDEENHPSPFNFNTNPVRKVAKRTPPSQFPSGRVSSQKSHPAGVVQANANTSVVKSSTQCKKLEFNIEPVYGSLNDISMDGWLSKSMRSSLKLEDTEHVKKEEYDDSLSEGSKSWINSIRNVFEVKIKPMTLVSLHNASTVSSNNNTTINNSSGNNFKAFVKKNNYPKQTVIIKTMAVASSQSQYGI